MTADETKDVERALELLEIGEAVTTLELYEPKILARTLPERRAEQHQRTRSAIALLWQALSREEPASSGLKLSPAPEGG